MGFLAPIAALVAAGITIPALVALYFLKLRRRQMVVPSTLLWKKAVQDLQVNAPFQRLRKNLLLLLQLLLLAALLFAFARPTTQTTAAPGQQVVILIDHSASMNATDVSPTRLDEAKRAALELIDGLDAGGSAAGGAMVVSFSQQARVVQPFTGDLALLRDAVRSLEPTDQQSNLSAALRLIEPFALRAAGNANSGLVVYVLSDGRAHSEAEQLTLSGANLKYIRVGETQPTNVGIVSFSARRDLEKPQIVQVFARLANYGPQAVNTNVTLRINGQVEAVKPARLAPAPADGTGEPGTQGVQFDFVLAGSALIELSHDSEDVLPADDAARLLLAPARRMRVLLVTATGNAFLDRVIRSVGVRDLVMMTPDKYENQSPDQLRRAGWNAPEGAGVEAGFDLVVFDGYVPKAVPPVPSLSLGAAPPIEGLRLVQPTAPAAEGEAESGEAAAQPVDVVLDWQRDHPVLRWVAFDDVQIVAPGRLVLPDDASVLAVSTSGPIMAEVAGDGQRHVVVSFDVLKSNWPMVLSFPVFMTNVVQTLGLGGLADETGLAYATGDVAVVPVSDTGAASLHYDGPVDLEAPVTQGRATLPLLTRVGLYASDSDAVEPPYDQIPVNLLDPVESDLRAVDQLSVGTSVIDATARSEAVRREVWHWFAWAALALLMVEWLVYTRRMHL